MNDKKANVRNERNLLMVKIIFYFYDSDILLRSRPSKAKNRFLLFAETENYIFKGDAAARKKTERKRKICQYRVGPSKKHLNKRLKKLSLFQFINYLRYSRLAFFFCQQKQRN